MIFSEPLFWVYCLLQFHIFVFLTNRIGIRPHHGVNEFLWTFFFLTVQISPSYLLADSWDFTWGSLPGLAWVWKLFLALVFLWVAALWVDHAWWLLFRKKPATYREVRSHYPNRPSRWPAPFAFTRFVGFPNQCFDLKVVEYEVALPRWPRAFDGLTIVQLSDIHFGKYIHQDYVRFVVKEAQKLKADLFVLTGDFVSFTKHIAIMQGLLKGFKARLGVYALLGNHDHWAGAHAMRQALEADGIRVLQNEVVDLKVKGKRLALMGVDDKWVGEKNDEPLLKAKGDAKILLAHQPDHLYLAHKTRANLQLSGHCHGGQICFPVLGPLVVPANEGRKYAGGFHREKDTVIYIHRGIGCYPPLRTYCNPEVVRLTLRTDPKDL
ncbi:MAG TPA: metallophosphoesterase [bacterium]|nr:metallophosphoesterase [bacterium]